MNYMIWNNLLKLNLIFAFIVSQYNYLHACQIPATKTPYVASSEPDLARFDVVFKVVVERNEDFIRPEKGFMDKEFAQLTFKIIHVVKGQFDSVRVKSIIFRSMCAPTPPIGVEGFIAGSLVFFEGDLILNIQTLS